MSCLQKLLACLVNRRSGVVDGSQDRVTMRLPRHLRQMLADANPRHTRCDGAERPADLRRGAGFRVPRFQLARSANQEQDDALLRAASALLGSHRLIRLAESSAGSDGTRPHEITPRQMGVRVLSHRMISTGFPTTRAAAVRYVPCTVESSRIKGR